jgi:hypothetical protein
MLCLSTLYVTDLFKHDVNDISNFSFVLWMFGWPHNHRSNTTWYTWIELPSCFHNYSFISRHPNWCLIAVTYDYVRLHDWWKQHSNNIQLCTTKTSSCFSGMDSSMRSPSSPQPILIELGLTTLHIHEWTSTVNGFFPPTVWIWGYHHKHELAIMNSTPFLKSIALFYFFSIGQQIISKIIR